MTLTIRTARTDERDTVAGLWTGAAAWLRDQGRDQWQYPVKLDNIDAALRAGTCWLVDDEGGRSVATITLDDVADPRLWLPEDRPATGRYVHRMVTDRSARIPGLGAALLDWAGHRADLLGADWLRLDAWTTNNRLHEYYRRQGFRHVRTVDAPAVQSGVLFERRAGTGGSHSNVELMWP